MKKSTVIGIVVSLIALTAGWFWGSPYYTLHQMRAAAEQGDTDKLASYIDFPALRSSLKEELKAKAAAEFTKEGNGMAALGAALAMNMVDGMVDGMITPATMRKVFVRDKTSGPEGITKVDATANDLEIDRTGIDQFRLRPKVKDDGNGLIFTRHGLGWRLSAMRIPD